MPKAAGEDLKAVRGAPRPQPPSRSIMHQSPPSAPLVRPMTPGAPKFADQLKPEAKHESGSVDPKQMHY
jgi:hypothetical protein